MSRKKEKTEYAKLRSLFAKLDNKIKKEKENEKKKEVNKRIKKEEE